MRFSPNMNTHVNERIFRRSTPSDAPPFPRKYFEIDFTQEQPIPIGRRLITLLFAAGDGQFNVS